MRDEHVVEQIELYAAGALSDEERREVEAHLAVCRACAAEAREALEATSLLAHALPLRTPAASLRAAVLEAVTAEARRTAARGARRSWRSAMVLACALTAVLILGLLTWQTLTLARLEREIAGVRTALQIQERLTDVLTGPDVVVVPMQVVSARAPQARGIVIILPVHLGRPTPEVIVVVAGLPVPQKDALYQAWLQEGDRRISVGVLGLDPTGAGVIRYRLGRGPLVYQGLGITYERGGPVASPQGPRILVARFAGKRP